MLDIVLTTSLVTGLCVVSSLGITLLLIAIGKIKV